METFDPKSFVEAEIGNIRKSIGNERALVAVSGGVDSTTCAVLTHKAIGENLVCVILDDAFMRENEPEHVAKTLSKPPLNVPTKVVNVRNRFLQAMKGLKDAEEKRKMFRETFYQVLGETVKKEDCTILVQGTIRADIVETVGGVKTQHNVLEQMGINPMERYGFKVVEPLKTLYKEQVRMVARYLGLPPECSERQPFPGPGLSVRVVGEIFLDKLETLRKATAIVERGLERHKPSQYFAVILDNEEVSGQSLKAHIQEITARFLNVPSRNVSLKIFRDKATGVEGGKRRYGYVVGVKVQTANKKTHQASVQHLVSLQRKIITENPAVTRIFYAIKDVDEKKQYVIGVRAVETKDFLTAKVSEIPWATLSNVADAIITECSNIAAVYYDVTPKPPATIEME
ncbi:MAG: ATP-binding protein [Candidatus Bathyarchaeia archaeon]